MILNNNEMLVGVVWEKRDVTDWAVAHQGSCIEEIQSIRQNMIVEEWWSLVKKVSKQGFCPSLFVTCRGRKKVCHLEIKEEFVCHLEMKEEFVSPLQMRAETEGKHLGFWSPPCIAECWIQPSPLCFQTFRRRQSPWRWPSSTPVWNSSSCWQRRCSSSTVSR